MRRRGNFIEQRQVEHYTNPEEQPLETLAEDDEADVLTTFAEEGTLTSNTLKSSR